MFRRAKQQRDSFGGCVFEFLERRRLFATTALAGRSAVALPSGAWIGGYEAHLITAWKYCKAGTRSLNEPASSAAKASGAQILLRMRRVAGVVALS